MMLKQKPYCKLILIEAMEMLKRVSGSNIESYSCHGVCVSISVDM